MQRPRSGVPGLRRDVHRALPRLDRGEKGEKLYRIPGQPPSLIFVPPGCPFHPRCSYARVPGPCNTERPAFRLLDDSPPHWTACHYAEDLQETSPEGLVEELNA